MQNIDKINTIKEHGLSQISIKYFKKAAYMISPFLDGSCNKCIEPGHFRNQLKIAEVTPVYKTGNQNK